MNYSIYAESTPNPEVMKFVSNRMLADKSIELTDANMAKKIPLANELFKLPFVKSVFISANFISVTKIENVQWEDIALQLRIYITDFLNSIEVMNHTENIDQIEVEVKESENKRIIKKEFLGDERKIADLLDEYIRPAVESITLKQGIEGLLKQKMGDKIKEVISRNN